MTIRFTKEADADLEYFYKSGNKKAISKIKELLTAMTANPYTGIGQPEPLKYNLAGSCHAGSTGNIGSFTML